MASNRLRSDFHAPYAIEFKPDPVTVGARTSPLSRYELGLRSKPEKRMTPEVRARLASLWRAMHYTPYPVRCGDAWPPLLGRTYCLI